MRQEPYTYQDVEEALAFLDKWRSPLEIQDISDPKERAETLEKWFDASNIRAWNQAHPNQWISNNSTESKKEQ